MGPNTWVHVPAHCHGHGSAFLSEKHELENAPQRPTPSEMQVSVISIDTRGSEHGKGQFPTAQRASRDAPRGRENGWAGGPSRSAQLARVWWGPGGGGRWPQSGRRCRCTAPHRLSLGQDMTGRRAGGQGASPVPLRYRSKCLSPETPPCLLRFPPHPPISCPSSCFSSEPRAGRVLGEPATPLWLPE